MLALSPLLWITDNPAFPAGGLPNFELMTEGRFTMGLVGCVHQLSIQGQNVDLATDLQGASNVSPCVG